MLDRPRSVSGRLLPFRASPIDRQLTEETRRWLGHWFIPGITSIFCSSPLSSVAAPRTTMSPSTSVSVPLFEAELLLECNNVLGEGEPGDPPFVEG